MRRVAVILLLLAAVVGLLLLETETGRAREPDAPRAPPREAGHARLASAPAEEEAPPESAAIRGLVRDADGLPAPGARVRLFPDRAGGAPDAWRDLAPVGLSGLPAPMGHAVPPRGRAPVRAHG